MSVKDEISAMLSTFEGGRDTSTDIKESEEVVEEVAEDENSTDEIVDEPVIEEEEVKESEELEELEDNQEEDKDSIINDLRDKISKLEGSKVEPEPEVKPKSKFEPITIDPQDFVGELDLEYIYNDKEAFNNLLNKVYTEGINNARKTIVEEVLRSIPDIVKTNINVMSELKQTSEQFYKANPDLSPFKKVVAVVFEDIAAQNPGKPYADVLKKVAPEVRKRLELQQKAAGKPTDKKLPRLPSKIGGPRPSEQKPNTGGIESDIAEMNKVIGR